MPPPLRLLLIDDLLQGQKTTTLAPGWMVRNSMKMPEGELYPGLPISPVVEEEQH